MGVLSSASDCVELLAVYLDYPCSLLGIIVCNLQILKFDKTKFWGISLAKAEFMKWY